MAQQNELDWMEFSSNSQTEKEIRAVLLPDGIRPVRVPLALERPRPRSTPLAIRIRMWMIRRHRRMMRRYPVYEEFASTFTRLRAPAKLAATLRHYAEDMERYRAERVAAERSASEPRSREVDALKRDRYFWEHATPESTGLTAEQITVTRERIAAL